MTPFWLNAAAYRHVPHPFPFHHTCHAADYTAAAGTPLGCAPGVPAHHPFHTHTVLYGLRVRQVLLYAGWLRSAMLLRRTTRTFRAPGASCPPGGARCCPRTLRLPGTTFCMDVLVGTDTFFFWVLVWGRLLPGSVLHYLTVPLCW